jgi:glyoxylate reductase
MNKFKVAITKKPLPAALEQIRKLCDIRMWEGPGIISRTQLLEWLRDAEGLLSSGDVRVDGELLASAPQLRVIAQSSVGYDNIDIDACTNRGIPFGNTPGVLVDATADLTFGLLLSAARRIHVGWDQVRTGRWGKGADVPFGVDLSGKTLGIVGMGAIGTAVAKRAKAFGLNIIYHNRTPRPDERLIGATFAAFDDLLAESDFIVVLVPLSNQTRGLFGEREFARMKSTAYFINASRGQIVNTEALHQALLHQQIAYAALDVTDPEPIPARHPLLRLPNILITPHVGSATYETRNRMAELTADNLLAGLMKKPLPACVNSAVNFK